MIESEGKQVNANINIRYVRAIKPIETISKGDWIDLRSGITIDLKQGEFALIPLGITAKLPDGYEAIVAPRSSTYKKWGIISANSIGVIDESYSGDGDEWKFPAIALRDTHIDKNDRICQFRIVKHQPNVTLTEVEHTGEVNRGGIGSTGHD